MRETRQIFIAFISEIKKLCLAPDQRTHPKKDFESHEWRVNLVIGN